MDIWAEQLANATSAYKAGDYKVKADANQNSYTKKFSIADTLKQQLEKISENKLQEVGAYIHIGKTSNFIMNLLDIDEMDVYMTAKKARTVISSAEDTKEHGFYKEKENYHNLAKDLFYKALVRSEHPLVAFVADGKGEEKKNKIELVTNLRDNEKNPIISVHEIRAEGNVNVKKIVIDKAVTVYGKRNLKVLLDRAKDSGRLLFIDKNRGQELEHLSRIVQFDAPSISFLNLTDNIKRFSEIIKRQYEQIIKEHSGKVAQRKAQRKNRNFDNETSQDINQLKKSIDVDSDIEMVQEKNETLKAMNDILKKRLHVKGNYILKPNEIDSISEQILKDTNSTYPKRKLNAALTRIFTYLTKNNVKKADAAMFEEVIKVFDKTKRV